VKGFIDVQGEPFSLRTSTPRAPLSPHADVPTAPFVGSDLSVTPGSSAFGTLARLVRLNELPPAALVSLFGVRTHRKDDLSSVMAFSEARQVALAKALGLPDVPAEWNLSTWFPFKAPSTLLSTAWAFRYCPGCLRTGYHTLLHQLPWIDRCPWHGQPLLEDCVSCGRALSASAAWEGAQNLGCACGHCALDTDAALYALKPPGGAAEFVEGYRAWAAAERAAAELAVPERASDPRSALAALVRMPAAFSRTAVAPPEATGDRRSTWRQAAPHTRLLTAASTAPTPDREALVRLDDLRQDRPGFVTTPKRLVPAMTAVAARLALQLPAASLTDGEMTLFLAGAGIEAPGTFEPAGREFSPELSMLPPTQVGERHFLNLTCVHPAAYRAIPVLLDAAFAGRPAFDFYAQATATEFDLVIRASRSILSRGYAEGLRSTLATHVPGIYALPRDAPRLTLPWVLLRRHAGRVASIRITWTPLRGTPMGEAAILTAEDEANRRRQRARPASRSRGK